MPRQEFTELTREVGEITTVAASASALLDGLSAKLGEIIANGIKREEVIALKDAIDSSGNDLAAAVARNTPASEEPPVEG